jgi:hypothetical protein
LKTLLWCFGAAIEALEVKTQVRFGWAATTLVRRVLPGCVMLEVSSILG